MDLHIHLREVSVTLEGLHLPPGRAAAVVRRAWELAARMAARDPVLAGAAGAGSAVAEADPRQGDEAMARRLAGALCRALAGAAGSAMASGKE